MISAVSPVKIGLIVGGGGSVCWIRTGPIHAWMLASIGGGRHLVPAAALDRSSLSPFGILDFADALKVKVSLAHALPRFCTRWKRAACHTAAVQYLDISDHISHPGFKVKNLVHPLASRRS
jgi:hypothetical protein